MPKPSHGIFDLDIKARIGFARASDIEDMPESPGIYAWYLPLRGDDGGDLITFLKTLEKNTELYTPVTNLAATGTQRQIQIERNPPRFEYDSPTLQRLASTTSSHQIQSIANIVLMLSFLSEPFYIGMTDSSFGLRGRIKQHLASVNLFDADNSWTGAFRTRVAKTLQQKDALKRCLIAYFTLPEELESGEAARLLEHILIRTIKPAQSKRG
jgi:hypothetical protein